MATKGLRAFCAVLGAGLVGCGGAALVEEPEDGEPGAELARQEEALEAPSCRPLPELKEARELLGEPDSLCTGVAGDDDGNLALALFLPDSRMAEWRMLAPSGALLGGGGSGGQVELLAQPRGFHALSWDGQQEASLSAYSNGGVLLRERTVLDPEDAPGRVAAAVDPEGGSLVVVGESTSEDSWRLMARRFDAKGRLVSERRVAKGHGPDVPLVYAAVDLKGRSLVLWDESVQGQVRHVMKARWLERDGTAATSELIAAIEDHPQGPPRLSPLIGGGVAMGRGSRWLTVLRSGSSRTAPVPDWLAEHPDARPVVLRKSRGYALLPPRSYIPTCEQTVTLLAADGAPCGTLRIPITPCRRANLELGRDGTLMQELQGDDRCTVRWWPRQLR